MQSNDHKATEKKHKKRGLRLFGNHGNRAVRDVAILEGLLGAEGVTDGLVEIIEGNLDGAVGVGDDNLSHCGNLLSIEGLLASLDDAIIYYVHCSVKYFFQIFLKIFRNLKAFKNKDLAVFPVADLVNFQKFFSKSFSKSLTHSPNDYTERFSLISFLMV